MSRDRLYCERGKTSSTLMFSISGLQINLMKDRLIREKKSLFKCIREPMRRTNEFL
jgi:hypothetical protein